MWERISVASETSKSITPSLMMEDTGGNSGEDWPGVV
jgi:hypothetical protein